MKAAFFLVVGALLIIGAAVLARDVQRFVRQAIQVPGIVSALRAGGSHPQITFETADRQPVSYAQNGLIIGYHVGDPVAVLYRANDPRGTASIDTVGALWALPILLFGLGLGFCVIAIANLVLGRRG